MRRARERTGLHQAQIGAILGVHQRTVANYEGGNTEPKIEILKDWARITNVPTDWLILGITPEAEDCPRCGTGATQLRRATDTRSRCFPENTQVSSPPLTKLEGNVFYPSFDAPRNRPAPELDGDADVVDLVPAN